MILNPMELELLAKETYETRVREADAARQIADARAANPIAPRTLALSRIASGGSRVRWWFRSRLVSPPAPIASSRAVFAAELATTAVDTVSASDAMLPADAYEALVVIARGTRQRHERLVTQRS